jgi:glutamate/tyrosine decarboxylase-like PLP-dependent enzyme
MRGSKVGRPCVEDGGRKVLKELDRERDEARPARDDVRASSLDIAPAGMEELSAQVVALVTEYFARVSEMPVFPAASAEDVAQIFRQPPPVAAEPLERVLEDCRRMFETSRHNGHPRFFGYIASPSTPVGAFATLIASALNSNVTSWRSAPAATEIERTVVRWLGSLIGCGEECGGLLTSGGSMANLNALFIAHRTKLKDDEASDKGLWNARAPATLYASDQVHLSIPKAADVMGLGREQVRVVTTDERFQMDVRGLRELIAGDIERGARPFCIVASAGTTSTGAVDPLEEIARVAEEYSLWFHVDGAYGALAALDSSKRAHFKGIERADSVSLDPHKWLYTPVDCGCLLLRVPAHAPAAFSATEQDYIKIYAERADEAFAFWDYGVELSRPFRALKVWMLLRYYGVERLAAAIAEDNALALYMAASVEAAADFQLLAPATLGICCFRYVPPRFRELLQTTDAPELAHVNAQLDVLNERVMQIVQRGGRAYLSNAMLRGRFALRASITNFRTTRRDIDITLETVRDAAHACSKEQL